MAAARAASLSETADARESSLNNKAKTTMITAAPTVGIVQKVFQPATI